MALEIFSGNHEKQSASLKKWGGVALIIVVLMQTRTNAVREAKRLETAQIEAERRRTDLEAKLAQQQAEVANANAARVRAETQARKTVAAHAMEVQLIAKLFNSCDAMGMQLSGRNGSSERYRFRR